MHNCFEVCDELKKCKSSLQIFKVMNTYLNKYCGGKDNIEAEHIIDSEKEIAAIFKMGDKIKTTVIKNPKAEEVAKIFNDFFNQFGI